MSIITLTTDFGGGSHYVAAMKGVILGINPQVRLVDLSHSIRPQNIRQGAFALAEASTWFPAGTIHVGVIDPGVGTSRRLVYARIGDQQYLAPDNGLLSLLTKRQKPSRIIQLTNSEFWLPEVSSTFHGRDVLAPLAAQLSLGVDPEQLGPSIAELTQLEWPDPVRVGNRLEGVVLSSDSFGNLITNISAGHLSDAKRTSKVTITCGASTISGLSQTYGDHRPGEPIALVGSGGNLEIALVDGNAAERLGIADGTPVSIEW